MNVYIFLILVIVIAVLFISKKDKIKEGMSSVHNEGYLLDWGGKNYMNDCNDYTTSVGPYKSNRGNWLVAPCQTGYNDAMNGKSSNNSCSATYKGNTSVDNWKRSACYTGVHLGNFKKPLKAVEKQGYIELVGDQFVTPVRGKHFDIKDRQGKDLIFTRDYTLEFEIYPRKNNYEPENGIPWRSIFSRKYNESQGSSLPPGSRVPGIWFWEKKFGKTGYELHIRTNTLDQHGTLNDGIDTVPIPPNKWTKVVITLKESKLTVKLSKAITKNYEKTIKSEGTDARHQYYYRKDMPCKLYLGDPNFYSTNAKIKNMKWTNHPDKRCFARLPTGCERALGELNKKNHTEYNKSDTGWIEGGWGWNGTDNDCHNNRKKAFNDYCKKSDAMVMVSDSLPDDKVMGGWAGHSQSINDATNVIKMSTYPQCKAECESHPECNNIRWTTKDKVCTLMRAAPETNTDGRWAFMKLWENFRGMGKKEGFTPVSGWTYCADENGVCNINGKEIIRYGESISSNYIDKEFGTVGQDTPVNCNNNIFTDPIVGTPKKCWKKPATNTASQIATAIGIKNPNNITEHTMENKNLSWEQAQKKCQNNKKNLASKSELLGFIQEKDNGDSWVPVSDGTNNWLQIGTRMSKKNLTDANPTVVDYGLLHQEIEDVKRYTGSKLPNWGMNTTSWPWKKKYYCSGTYEEPEQEMGKCPENCVKPTKITGNCQKGNPIETVVDGEIKYYKSCSYKCLGPQDDGYKDLEPKEGETYDVDKNGCRASTQCGDCGTELVEIKGKFVEQNADGVIKRSFVEDKEETKSKDRKKFNDINEILNKMTEKYDFKNNYSYDADNANDNDEETKNNIQSNQQNIADTTQSNMFTDITNANHIGERDDSLEDYYRRRILNNSTENRLGGSSDALRYLKRMPEDDNGKVSFFNSVWTLFN